MVPRAEMILSSRREGWKPFSLFARCRADARRPGVRDRGTDASRRLWFRIGGGVLPSSVACGRRFACKGARKKGERGRERERELSEDPASADGLAVLKKKPRASTKYVLLGTMASLAL